MGKLVEIENIKFNEQVDETVNAVERYKEYNSSVDYVQAYSPIPIAVRFVATLFFTIICIIMGFELVKSGSVSGGTILMLVLTGIFMFIVWCMNIVTRAFLRSKSGDAKKYIAVVTDVVMSGVTYDTHGAGKLVLMHIPQTDEYIHYETNSSKPCNFKEGERYQIYASKKYKLWDFVNRKR